MKTKTKVVVVGGGVVGVSALYHLAKKGWSDVVLVERKELTSGSTWHAAGLLPLFNMSYSVGQLHKYAVDLYKKLEEETGKNVGFSVVSNIRLASTKDRMDEYHQYAGVAQTIGVDVKFLTPEQVKEIWPLCHTDDLVGAIQHPEDGYIQPADLTQALAKGVGCALSGNMRWEYASGICFGNIHVGICFGNMERTYALGQGHLAFASRCLLLCWFCAFWLLQISQFCAPRLLSGASFFDIRKANLEPRRHKSIKTSVF